MIIVVDVIVQMYEISLYMLEEISIELEKINVICSMSKVQVLKAQEVIT